MDQSKITFIINGNTYSLRAGDPEAISAIPGPERRQLIALLEAVKQQEIQAQAVAQRALDKARLDSRARSDASRPADPVAGPGRLGRGDVDALMARLVLEEKRGKKPLPTRQVLYKWIAGLTVAVIVLILVL